MGRRGPGLPAAAVIVKRARLKGVRMRACVRVCMSHAAAGVKSPIKQAGTPGFNSSSAHLGLERLSNHRLDGLNVLLSNHAPRPLHLGGQLPGDFPRIEPPSAVLANHLKGACLPAWAAGSRAPQAPGRASPPCRLRIGRG